MGIFKYIKKKVLINNTKEFLDKVKKHNGLQKILSTLFLDNNEKAFIEEVVSLKENLTSVITKDGGLGLAIGPISLNPQSITSEKTELKEIDQGKLVITNKHLIFSGFSENRVIKINSIISYKTYLDCVSISYKENSKISFFYVKNPYITSIILEIVIKMRNPENFAETKLDVQFK